MNILKQPYIISGIMGGPQCHSEQGAETGNIITFLVRQPTVCHSSLVVIWKDLGTLSDF